MKKHADTARQSQRRAFRPSAEYTIMKDYYDFVDAIRKVSREAREIKLPIQDYPAPPSCEADAPTVLIFSPHPDDECVTGALPLRLLHENRCRIINVAVTLGSNRERQHPRLNELRSACGILGFELILTAPNGLEKVNPASREERPGEWDEKISIIADIIDKAKPAAVMLPHRKDWNATHVGTHMLVMDAIRKISASPDFLIIETEYWGAMDSPNVMLEVPDTILATQITALSTHIGEIKRNPYHISLPAWSQDNVRRGSELISGQGEAAPDITFAALYRLSTVKENKPIATNSIIIPADRSPAKKLTLL